MRSLLLASTLLSAVSVSAFAADLPSRVAPIAYAQPVLSWTGFYLGVTAGGTQLRNTTVQGDEDLAYMPLTGKGFGGALGVTAGYNMQFNRAVLGVEADASFLLGNDTGRILGFSDAYYTKVKANWFGTLRGRAGFAFDNVLVYGTGGVAVVNAKYTNIYDGYACGDTSEYSGCGTKAKAGLTFGGGIEVMLSERVSFKTEYLYVTLPTVTINDASSGGSYPYHHDVDMHVVRAGVNYKF